MTDRLALPRPGSLGLIQYAGVDMLQYAATVSAADNAALRVELDEWRFTNKVDELDRHVTRQAERIKVLEDALRHVNKCLSINDYGDYVLLSLFDAEIVRTALGDKT